MKRLCLSMIFALLGTLGWAPAQAANVQDEMPDAEKMRFCKRIRDHAIQALYRRDGGVPMKLYAEDGANGPRIMNVIIRHIYEDSQITTPQQAGVYGQDACNQMMETKGVN